MQYHNVQIMVKPKDYELIKKVAELRGLKVSVFMRMITLDAIRGFPMKSISDKQDDSIEWQNGN